MYWSLIAAGVTAGLGLVAAKQWFDRQEEDHGATDRRWSVDSPSVHRAEAQLDSAVPSASSTEPSTQGTGDDGGVEEALASGDLAVMETRLRETNDPIHRNRLFNRLVAGHYRLRTDSEHRNAFYRLAHAQIDEASAILSAIEKTGAPSPDHIEAFKSIAIALDEDRRYDEAVAICAKALSLGLKDGTKTGFEGRVARLTRQRDAK